jgi:hypothetical protein
MMLGTIKRVSLGISASVLAFAVGATVAFAQEYGKREAPPFEPKALARGAPDAPIPPFRAFGNANYGTGGVALRNRGAGSISVSGVTGAVQAAYLYWAVIDPNSASASIFINRRFPIPLTGPGIVLTGTVVSTGPQPCWAGNTIVVYRAEIPLSLVSPGNGEYEVTLLPGAAGSTAGGDPWASPVILPLWEGASIVMIGTGGSPVNLFDGLPGGFFEPPFSYSLALTGSNASFLWDNIGADGQVGTSRDADASTSGETTSINGLLIAGPGSALNLTGDWNGSSGFPLPQLWDDTGHQFTLPAATNTLNITFDGADQDDCLTLVANVVRWPAP